MILFTHSGQPKKPAFKTKRNIGGLPTIVACLDPPGKISIGLHPPQVRPARARSTSLSRSRPSSAQISRKDGTDETTTWPWQTNGCVAFGVGTLKMSLRFSFAFPWNHPTWVPSTKRHPKLGVLTWPVFGVTVFKLEMVQFFPQLPFRIAAGCEAEVSHPNRHPFLNGCWVGSLSFSKGGVFRIEPTKSDPLFAEGSTATKALAWLVR